MSYQVLARKWRPKDFGSLVGQEHVVRALRHALEKKRLHHAYLFTGTRGVGKTTLARILAKCLNCETGVTPEPCGKCAACVEIDGGRFPDLIEIDAATNTGIDEMRALQDSAAYSPSGARYKVFVIDEVHMLSKPAFNSMLKTFEEPPEHVKFILATTDPQKIPVTVLSRCLQFNLKQMPPAAIIAHLGKVLEQEKVAFEPGALPLLARAAAGSMRDALSLLDQAIAHGGGRLASAGVAEMLGAIDQGYLLRLVDALIAQDAAALLAIVDEMQERSLSYEFALADLAGLFLRMALEHAAPGAGSGDASGEARIGELAGRLDAESVQLYYQIALQGREDLPLAPDAHAGFTMTLLRMLAFRPESGGRALSTSERTATPKAQAGRPASAAAAGGGLADWQQLVQQLQVAGAARELARNAELRKREGDLFELVVPKAKAYLAERNYADKLKAALEQLLGRAASIKVAVGEAGGATVAAAEAGEREARRAAAAKSVQSDSFVNDLVNLFDGKVVDSSVREGRK